MDLTEGNEFEIGNFKRDVCGTLPRCRYADAFSGSGELRE